MNSEMKNANIINGKRAIAIFDILGFRELIKTAELSLLPDIVKSTINLSKGSLLSDKLVGSIVFSDTIVMFGLSGREYYDESWVIVSSSNLLNMSARFDVPIRGALTFGEIYINQKEKVVIGPALVKGYDLEQKQNWMGAIIDPDYNDRFNKGLLSLPDTLHNNVISYYAPLKSGIRKKYNCIGWLHRSKPSEKNLYSIFNRNNEDEISNTVYQKYINTVEYLRYCKENYPTDFEVST
jgi:hypothetical protein